MNCPNCGAQMDYTEDKQMAVCPYCDNKILLTESDDVKIERIRNERLHKDYETSLKYQNAPKKKPGKIVALVIVIIVVIIIILAAVFSTKDQDENYVPETYEESLINEGGHEFGESEEEGDEFGEPEEEEEYQLTAADKARLANGDSTYIWPTSTVTEKLPVADFENGKLKESTDRKLELEVYNISQKDYTDYIKQCKEAGFTYYEMVKENSFKADLEDHTHLEIAYTDDPHTYNSFTLKVELPFPMSDIEWPSNEWFDQMPEPPVTHGNLRVVEDNRALVLLDGVTRDQFAEYVQACIDEGFIVNDSFETIASLDFPNGDKHLGLMHKNWDVMQILITDKN